MNNVTSLAVDLAKNVFQLHGTDIYGKTTLKKKVSRKNLIETIVKLRKCSIYMEACSSSNYWGRKFKEVGHKVRLINPKYVKPYVKRNKNDVNDAAAIAAAARDPDMRFCEVKTQTQQDIQSIHRMRQLLIQQRTALSNQARGLLAEYGFVVPQGIAKIRAKLIDIATNNSDNMEPMLLSCFLAIYDNFKQLDSSIKSFDMRIEAFFKESEVCRKLEKIPGIGILGATILASVLGNGSLFKNGRHFAAFLGLTPKQHSSGGKDRLLSISKGGDTYIRTLLIHGARSVLVYANKHNKSDKNSKWIRSLLLRKGVNKTAVALANKLARIAWALLHSEEEYILNHKPIIKYIPKRSNVRVNKAKNISSPAMCVS